MAITIDGSSGIASVDGSAGSPSVRGTDANSGILYTSDAIKFSTGGTQRAVIDNNGLSSAGHILQVVSTTKSDTGSTSSTSFVDTGISAAITPISSSNKILISYDVYLSHTQSEVSFVNLLRGSTNIAQPSGSANYPATTLQYIGALVMGRHNMTYLDSPSTTSETTYKLQYRTDANTAYLNRYSGNDNYHGISHLTLMEVAA